MAEFAKEKTMMSKTRFKVCVHCTTYNHSHYISETMDGFCLQQTDFPFICTIMDDASTDGEAEVICQYMHDHFEPLLETEETDDYRLMVTRHKENKNCFFAVLLMKYNHFSIGKSRLPYIRRWQENTDYLAMCEGDDFWTDAHKLQRQADALDAAPHAYLAYTGFRIVDGDGKILSIPKIESYQLRSHSGDNLPTLLRNGNYVMTLTTMYRSKVFNSLGYLKCPYQLDFGFTLAAALMGDFIWMPEVTASYRSLSTGLIKSKRLAIKQKLNEIYHSYAGLIVEGKCKKMSFYEKINVRYLILMRSLKKKDSLLRKTVVQADFLSRLLTPVVFAAWIIGKLKKRCVGILAQKV